MLQKSCCALNVVSEFGDGQPKKAAWCGSFLTPKIRLLFFGFAKYLYEDNSRTRSKFP